jgi:hypothetical protein
MVWFDVCFDADVRFLLTAPRSFTRTPVAGASGLHLYISRHLSLIGNPNVIRSHWLVVSGESGKVPGNGGLPTLLSEVGYRKIVIWWKRKARFTTNLGSFL